MSTSSGEHTKHVYSEITKLKLLNAQTDPKFILEKNPFDDVDDDEEDKAEAFAALKKSTIIGRIYPDSDIYKEGSYRIEMKLIPTFPFDPPEVRFLTQIYHPNVDKDGQFCHEILKKTGTWSGTMSLVNVVKAVTEHIDKPNIDFSLSHSLGTEYIQNRSEFNRKALDFVKKHALPRE